MSGRLGMTAGLSAGAAFMMLSLAFASKPLYDTFCRVTGFGGETRRAEAAPEAVLDRQVRVRFDANIARGLPLEFKPLQVSQDTQVGGNNLAFYRLTNVSSRPLGAVATYNVSPHKAGPYFSKIECFCFEDMVIAPGESVELPVIFFVDPAIADDPQLDDVREITLSYTFFESLEEAADALGEGA